MTSSPRDDEMSFDSERLASLKEELREHYHRIEQSRKTIKTIPMQQTTVKANSKLGKIRDQIMKEKKAISKQTKDIYDEQKIPQSKPKMKIPPISDNNKKRSKVHTAKKPDSKLRKLRLEMIKSKRVVL
jgi:hypothetical protein